MPINIPRPDPAPGCRFRPRPSRDFRDSPAGRPRWWPSDPARSPEPPLVPSFSIPYPCRSRPCLPAPYRKQPLNGLPSRQGATVISLSAPGQNADQEFRTWPLRVSRPRRPHADYRRGSLSRGYNAGRYSRDRPFNCQPIRFDHSPAGFLQVPPQAITDSDLCKELGGDIRSRSTGIWIPMAIYAITGNEFFALSV